MSRFDEKKKRSLAYQNENFAGGCYTPAWPARVALALVRDS